MMVGVTHLVRQTGSVRQDIGCSCAQSALRAGKIRRVKLNARDGKKRKTAPAKCGLEDDSGGAVMVYDRLRRGRGRGSTDLKQKPEGMSSLMEDFGL